MSRKRILSSVLAAAALAAPIAAGVTAVTAPAEAAIAATALDTKVEVNNHYWNFYRPSQNVLPGWNGSASTCTIGGFTNAYLAAQQNALNVVRDMAGLDRVALGRSTATQQAALIMQANGKLSHTPTSDWRCYSSGGATAANQSNIGLWYPDGGAGETIDAYMADRGDSNTFVGHRRWLLYPFATTFYTGATTNANAIDVIGPTSTTRTNPAWVRWPRAGWHPNQMDPAGRWSIATNQTEFDWSQAVVRVYKNGSTTPMAGVVKYAPHNGYGMPTLVWQMPAESTPRVGNYKVTISGAKNKYGTTVAAFSYTVQMFTATAP